MFNPKKENKNRSASPLIISAQNNYHRRKSFLKGFPPPHSPLGLPKFDMGVRILGVESFTSKMTVISRARERDRNGPSFESLVPGGVS